MLKRLLLAVLFTAYLPASLTANDNQIRTAIAVFQPPVTHTTPKEPDHMPFQNAPYEDKYYIDDYICLKGIDDHHGPTCVPNELIHGAGGVIVTDKPATITITLEDGTILQDPLPIPSVTGGVFAFAIPTKITQDHFYIHYKLRKYHAKTNTQDVSVQYLETHTNSFLWADGFYWPRQKK